MKYETRIVAFIDILGFKNVVDKSNVDDGEFDRILTTLTELNKFFIKAPNKYQKDADNALDADTQIVQVSDSLIISRALQEQGGVYYMLSDCASAIHILISNGFLCRGVIKIGNMYHKGTTLFGEAYIRALQAEPEVKLPIIKFDRDLFDVVKRFPGPANKGYEDWEIDFIKNDCKELPTGIYYLDYFTDFDSRFGGGDGSASIHYSKLRDIIVKGLKLPCALGAYEKFRWAADQFNMTAKNYALDKIE